MLTSRRHYSTGGMRLLLFRRSGQPHPCGRPRRSLETVQFAPNEIRFRNGIRKSDGAAQRVASFINPVQFFEQRAAQPVQIEVSVQLASQRLDHLQCTLGTLKLPDCYRAIERHHGRWLQRFEHLVPVSYTHLTLPTILRV